METMAFIILRIVLAWMFLYPLKALLSNWSGTVGLVKLIIPYKTNFFAVCMVILMMLGSISILFGIYANIGAAFLFVYSLLGFVVHYRLSFKLSQMKLSEEAASSDKVILESAKELGVVGHVTSAQKNIVIAAALLVIVLLGSGPLSLVSF